MNAATQTIGASECLLRMYDEHHEIEDYQKGVPRWCTACGDTAILTAVQRLCRDEGLLPEKTVFVSGIGCSSRLPHYMNTYSFHGLNKYLKWNKSHAKCFTLIILALIVKQTCNLSSASKALPIK